MFDDRVLDIFHEADDKQHFQNHSHTVLVQFSSISISLEQSVESKIENISILYTGSGMV